MFTDFPAVFTEWGKEERCARAALVTYRTCGCVTRRR